MIQPKYATLRTMFADRVFRIPLYQRFYSWQSRHRADLFSDLRKLALADADYHHFMATIVCHQTSEVTPVGGTEYRLFDIVDGQQRLTTLILILKCIEMHLDDDPRLKEELASLLVKRDGNLVLLQTNNANEYMFNAFLRDGAVPAPEDIRTHADRHLRDAIQECRSFVGEWREKQGGVVSLLRLIQNRIGFVLYDTEDRRIVYTVFEVLNSRGLAVDLLDKCKSILMGRAFDLARSSHAADTAISALQSVWGNIYREIAEVSLSGQEVIRVAATLFYGPHKGKPRQAYDSLELLRAECNAPHRPAQIARRIYDVTRKLVALEKNIFLGPVTRVLHARILAVALQSTESLSPRERERALQQWERVTFRIFGLFCKDARTKVGEYVRLANAIINRESGASNYDEIMKHLRDLGADYPIDRAVTEGLRGVPCYGDPDFCRYVLWSYEEHLADVAGRNATVDEQARRDIWRMRAQDSIEHIFPQNPEPGGPWDGKMRGKNGRVVPHWDHVDRIGNLILLPLSLNSEAKRKSFRNKRRIYRKHNLRMVNKVVPLQDWTLNGIERRERRILAWAKKEWADLAET